MHSRPLTVTLAVMLLGVVPSSIAESGPHGKPIRFGPRMGLEARNIATIHEDRHGFIWVGSENGLYRFEGSRFVRYGRAAGLPSPVIRALQDGPNGQVWVATRAGVARGDHAGFQSLPLPDGASMETGQVLAFDKDGTAWAATSEGLMRLPLGTDNWIRVPAAGAPAESVLVAADGTVWAGCGLEVCAIREGDVRRYGAAEGVSKWRWNGMFERTDGRLYIFNNRRVLYLDRGSDSFRPGEMLPGARLLVEPARVPRGSEHIVFVDGGPVREIEGRWRRIYPLLGDYGASLAALLATDSGYWAAYGDTGLFYWPSDSGLRTRALDGRSDVQDILSLEDSTYVLTHARLYELEGKTFEVIRSVDLPDEFRGGNLLATPESTVWIAAQNCNLAGFDPVGGRMEPSGQPAPPGSRRCAGIGLGENGEIWMAARDRVIRQTGPGSERWVEVELPKEFQTSGPTRFQDVASRDGRLYFATARGLLARIDGEWTLVSEADGLYDDDTSHVAAAPNGDVWIAYGNRRGLSRIRLGAEVEVEHFHGTRGPSSHEIVSLAAAPSGAVWLTTGVSVDVFDGEKWRSSAMAGLPLSEGFRKGFGFPAGDVVLIGLSGAVAYGPTASLLREPAPPDTYITGVVVDGRKYVRDPEILLAPGQHSAEFQFASAKARPFQKTWFRHRIAGEGHEWHVTSSSSVRMFDLAVGTRRIEVQSRRDSGDWGPSAFTPAIVVERFWWERRITWVSAGLLLFGAVLLLWRRRSGLHVRERLRLAETVARRTEELQQTVDDLTREREMTMEQADQLRAARETALESLRVKNDFVATMSHEMRTPLNGVLGMSALLASTSLSEEQQELLTAIETSGNSLLAIINDILDFSKAEAGRTELETIDFDLIDTIEQCIDVVSAGAAKKGLALASFVDPDVPAKLRGDPLRLRQVLLNLSANAIKFTKSGGVDVRATLEDEGPESACVRFVVTDTGVGIPADRLERIFEPFTQADSSTTREFGGTGLGLAICTRLVAMMDGTFDVKSTVGQGTTFTFTAHFAKQPRLRFDGSVCSVWRGVRVLIAEANDVTAQQLESYCTAWRVESVRASSVSEALDMLRDARVFSRDFDCLIADAELPDAPFAALAEAVRTDPVLERVPIVLLATRTAHSEDEQAKIAGLDLERVLAKPIKRSALYDSIASVVGEELPERVGSMEDPAVGPQEAEPPQAATGDATSSTSLSPGREEPTTVAQSPAPPSSVSTPKSKPAADEDGPVILVAEDNPVNQKVVQRMLAKLGYRCVVVPDGQIAVDTVRGRDFAAILMDCQMPELDGYEATRQIREFRPSGMLPIIALTANALPSDRENCLNAGMDDHLSKPVSLAQLGGVLERYAPLGEPVA